MSGARSFIEVPYRRLRPLKLKEGENGIRQRRSSMEDHVAARQGKLSGAVAKEDAHPA
jgi:hypothetical protein